MKANDSQVFEKYCVVRQGSTWFAFPAVAVREITCSDSIVPLPRFGSLLAGVCHVRNEFLPVLRLHSLQDDLPADGQSNARLVVLTSPSGPWSVLVDEVAGLVPLEVSVDADVKYVDGWISAVMGSATLGDNVVRILDPNRLYCLAERELKRDGGASAQPVVWSHSAELAGRHSDSQGAMT
jgi:chemotaxis signal transduction protein